MAKKTIGYTIKSTSDEGVYYLVNRWEKHQAFWVEGEKLKPSMLFKTSGYAQRSLNKLLSIMEEYRTDDFMFVEVYELDTDLETMIVFSELEDMEVELW